jgi:serine protease
MMHFVSGQQTSYYWSGGKKHSLKETPGKYMVKLSEDINENVLKRELAKNRKLTYLSKIKNRLRLVVGEYTFDELKKQSSITNVMPVYKLGDTPFYLTGEILVQPKSGISITEILALLNNNATIKQQTKYNTFVLETENWNELLKYANKIYESGLVEYSQPNFIAQKERFQINDPLYTDQYYLNNTGQFGGTNGIDINAPENTSGWQTGVYVVRVIINNETFTGNLVVSGQ